MKFSAETAEYSPRTIARVQVQAKSNVRVGQKIPRIRIDMQVARRTPQPINDSMPGSVVLVSFSSAPVRRRTVRNASSELLVFRSGLIEDSDVRIRIFPKREKTLVRSAGFFLFSCECVSAAQLETGQNTNGIAQNDAAVI